MQNSPYSESPAADSTPEKKHMPTNERTNSHSSPDKPMGVGVDNNAANFDEVSLSTPVPSIQPQQNTEANSFKKKKRGLTMREYLSVGILFLVNLLNYMDRFTIAAVLSEVQKFFAISDGMAGLLQTVFIIFFMICAPICGYFGDRYNRKIIMIVGLVIWVSAVCASAFIPKDHFWAFILLRGIVGVGEASYSITAPTIIADMFTNVIRSRVLMLFYFAIPVGSGLGFIVGGRVASIFGAWQSALLVTPPIGVICLLAIIFFIQEPERGKAEKEQGAEKIHEQAESNYLQDVLYLVKNKTYVWSTIGYTAVVFVTGTLSWWTAIAIEHAKAHQKNLTTINELKSDEKASISLYFGIIMTLAGIIGVTSGTIFAQFWKRGQLCFKGHHNTRADPLVCMIGSIVACPFLFLGMNMISVNEVVSWIAIFISVTFLCLNWAVNVDMLLYIVLPNRRATATGMQILISHLFGDASGPYLIGLISDWIRGNNTTPDAHFKSLLYAFYIPTVLLVVSAVCFGVSAWTLLGDKKKFDLAMGYTTATGKITMTSKGLENGAFDNGKNA